jgi:hypothetical protein
MGARAAWPAVADSVSSGIEGSCLVALRVGEREQERERARGEEDGEEKPLMVT